MTTDAELQAVSQASAIGSRGRGGLGTLLLLVMTLAPFVYFSVGAFGPHLIAELGITTSDVGLLAVAGLVGAIAGALVAGSLQRRLRARGGSAFVVGTAAVAMIAMASAQGPLLPVLAGTCGVLWMGLATPFPNGSVRSSVRVIATVWLRISDGVIQPRRVEAVR